VARADVAVVGARGPVRLEGVGRAGRAPAGAALGDVALARRRAAHRARVPRRVLAGGVRAVAGIRGADVAVVGARGPVRLEGVGRAGGAGAGAGLDHVALAGCGPAYGARVPRRMLAGDGGAVALVEGAGVGGGRGGSSGRIRGVCRAGGGG